MQETQRAELAGQHHPDVVAGFDAETGEPAGRLVDGGVETAVGPPLVGVGVDDGELGRRRRRAVGEPVTHQRSSSRCSRRERGGSRLSATARSACRTPSAVWFGRAYITSGTTTRC
jgi:hypothetical protein